MLKFPNNDIDVASVALETYELKEEEEDEEDDE